MVQPGSSIYNPLSIKESRIMPLIRISDEAYHEIKEVMSGKLVQQLHRQGYPSNTISRTASALIRLQVKAERLTASLDSSQL